MFKTNRNRSYLTYFSPMFPNHIPLKFWRYKMGTLTRKSFKEVLPMKELFLHIGKLTINKLREYLSIKTQFVKKNKVIQLFLLKMVYINPFVPNASILYPLKISKHLKVF